MGTSGQAQTLLVMGAWITQHPYPTHCLSPLLYKEMKQQGVYSQACYSTEYMLKWVLTVLYAASFSVTVAMGRLWKGLLWTYASYVSKCWNQCKGKLTLQTRVRVSQSMLAVLSIRSMTEEIMNRLIMVENKLAKQVSHRLVSACLSS